jgi:hypothetical protein
MPDGDVRSLGVGERAELLALARRLLENLPNPSHAREVAPEIARRLEGDSSDAVKVATSA